MKKETKTKNNNATVQGTTSTPKKNKTKKSIKKIEIIYMPENVPFDEIKTLKAKQKKHSDQTGELNIEQLW